MSNYYMNMKNVTLKRIAAWVLHFVGFYVKISLYKFFILKKEKGRDNNERGSY